MDMIKKLYRLCCEFFLQFTHLLKKSAVRNAIRRKGPDHDGVVVVIIEKCMEVTLVVD